MRRLLVPERLRMPALGGELDASLGDLGGDLPVARGDLVEVLDPVDELVEARDGEQTRSCPGGRLV